MSVAVALGIGLICASATAGEAPAEEGLVGWWKLDETTGKSAADAATKGHAGALEGGLTFEAGSVDGRVGKAIALDGKAQCIRIADYKGITGTQPRTVMAWVKTATPGGELVSWGFNDAGKMFLFTFIRGRVGLTPKGGYLYMKDGVNDDKWHHVAVVVEEGSPPNLHDNVKLYLDGEPAVIDDIGLLDLWPIDTGDKLDVTIGRRFKGAIDDVRLYDRALTENQVKAAYQATK